MKKIIYAAVIAAFGFYGCDNRQSEIDSANRQRDSLASVIHERDSSINEFLASFNEIERNLDSISMRQDAISINVDKQGGELKSSAKDRINENIAAINAMMSENRAKIDELNKKLKGSNSRVAQFKKMVESLNNQLAEKDRELGELNDRLTQLNTQVAQLETSVDTLTQRTTAQSRTIDEQTTSLHTAYYVVGKSKELQKMQVIDRTGGLLGLGKSSRLMPDVDNSKFTRIDYVQVSNIPIDSKDAKVITSHPRDSYTLVKEDDKVVSLQISNPDKFWSASKYLVVVKD